MLRHCYFAQAAIHVSAYLYERVVCSFGTSSKKILYCFTNDNDSILWFDLPQADEVDVCTANFHTSADSIFDILKVFASGWVQVFSTWIKCIAEMEECSCVHLGYNKIRTTYIWKAVETRGLNASPAPSFFWRGTRKYTSIKKLYVIHALQSCH